MVQNQRNVRVLGRFDYERAEKRNVLCGMLNDPRADNMGVFISGRPPIYEMKNRLAVERTITNRDPTVPVGQFTADLHDNHRNGYRFARHLNLMLFVS